MKKQVETIGIFGCFNSNILKMKKNVKDNRGEREADKVMMSVLKVAKK